MQMPVSSRRTPAGNTATGWLKVLALVFMFIDHAGKVLFSNMQEMRVLGRIAFPLYVWCMIVGFFYTRCVWKYMLRVLVTGLVSQPLYVVALNHQWNEPNIFLTLLLGLCALWGIRENKYGSRIWAPAIALALATVLGANYGWKGVLLFILLYAVQESRAGIAAVMVSYFMFSCRCWGKWLRRFQRQFYCDSCCGSESLLGARPDVPHRAPAETPTHNMSGLHLGRGCTILRAEQGAH